jgi:hypothetical protein
LGRPYRRLAGHPIRLSSTLGSRGLRRVAVLRPKHPANEHVVPAEDRTRLHISRVSLVLADERCRPSLRGAVRTVSSLIPGRRFDLCPAHSAASSHAETARFE